MTVLSGCNIFHQCIHTIYDGRATMQPQLSLVHFYLIPTSSFFAHIFAPENDIACPAPAP